MKDVLTSQENSYGHRQHIQLLKKHFPQCFDKNGTFMIHKMKETLKDQGVPLSQEGYGLQWLGKSYAHLLANDPPQTLLAEEREHNRQPLHDNSQNLLVQGDNLEVLKHLVHAYHEKVKMIYIDPPYNTGSDGFVYHDNRTFTLEQLAELADISEEEAKRILDFTRRKSNSHSAWLTFMYPRLYLARELLREDGVIFISIDDNEQAQLKMLCDEIFGEENSLTESSTVLIWQQAGTTAGHFANAHEYILVYAKNKTKTPLFVLNDYGQDSIIRHSALKKISKANPISEITFEAGSIEFEGDHGEFEGILGGSEKQYLDSPLIFKEGKLAQTVNIKAGWAMKNQIRSWLRGEPTYDSKEQKIIRFYFNKDGMLKYEKERKTIHPKTIIPKECGTTKTGSTEITELFQHKIFDYPKPVSLLKWLLSFTTKSHDIILDFFAGSGTTAHAVMQLNAEDGGQRRCISVQMDEPTDKKSEAYKAGYPTIFDITKARLEKAAAQIGEKYPDKRVDLGFKIFKTIPVFQGYLDEWNDINTTQNLFDGEQLTDQQLHSLLITWKVYDGIDLCQDLKPILLNTSTAYSVNHLIYLMHKGFNTEDLKVFITRLEDDKSFSPSKLILFGYNFDSKNQREIKEALAQYTNKKHIKMDVVVRY